jgi:hypothetical protein
MMSFEGDWLCEVHHDRLLVCLVAQRKPHVTFFLRCGPCEVLNDQSTFGCGTHQTKTAF